MALLKATYKGYGVVDVKSAEEWRSWLAKNHKQIDAVWLLMYKKETGESTLIYENAVVEALCYGWVDSKPNKRDERTYYLFFSQRNPKSNWSKPNRERIEKLENAGKLSKAGKEMVKVAKETGTWTALIPVENLEIPADMQALFDENPQAFIHYEAFPPSVKKGILEWILNAKQAVTRTKRIKETVDLAQKNKRANQYNPN